MRVLAAATLLLMAGLAQAQTIEGPRIADDQTLSLKGVTLGMPFDEAKALLGASNCKELRPGLTRCVDERVEVNGVLSDQMLDAMDGKVVNLEYRYLPFPASEPIRDVLIEKYGTPTTLVEGRGSVSLGNVIPTRAVYWKDIQGGELSYVPWASSVVKARAMGTLRLYDALRYEQFIAREQGRYTPARTASDL